MNLAYLYSSPPIDYTFREIVFPNLLFRSKICPNVLWRLELTWPVRPNVRGVNVGDARFLILIGRVRLLIGLETMIGHLVAFVQFLKF